MKKNVGTFDATMRITWGLTGLAWGISRMIRYPHRGMPLFITMLSAMKVAEGVTRWCPALELFGISTVEKTMDEHKLNGKPLVNPYETAPMEQVVNPME